MPDPNEPGSWRDMYWWRVITRMHNEWERKKHESDEDGKGSGPATRTTEDGAVRRRPGAPRKMPQLPSERKK